MKKSRVIRIPEEAYEEFLKKHRKMEETVRSIYGNPEIRLPYSKSWVALTNNPIYINDSFFNDIEERRKRNENDRRKKKNDNQ